MQSCRSGSVRRGYATLRRSTRLLLAVAGSLLAAALLSGQVAHGSGREKPVPDDLATPAFSPLTQLLGRGSAASDVTGTITAGGPSVPLTISTAGDNARFTFSGAAGQRVSLNITSVQFTNTGGCGCAGLTVSILNPDGSTLRGPFDFGSSGKFIDTVSLPTAGTYTVFLDAHLRTGSLTMTLYDVPADQTPVIAPGSPLALSFTVPGQNAVASFAGSVGERISLNFNPVAIGNSGCTCTGVTLSLKKPDGSLLWGPFDTGSSGRFLDTTVLQQAGTYTIEVNPNGALTGSITLSLYDVPADQTPSLTPSSAGGVLPLSFSVPGQNAAVAFSGTTGQKISLNFNPVAIGNAGCACTGVTLSIKKPDGSVMWGPFDTGSSGRYLDRTTLDQTGSYSIEANPNGALTGNITLKLYDVPPDVTGTLAIRGNALAALIGTPGQNAQLGFTGFAGRPIKVTLTNVTITGGGCGCNGATLSILKPDGTTHVSQGYGSVLGKTLTTTLPVDGVYTIFLNGNGANTGNTTVTLTDTAPSQAPTQSIGTVGGRGSIALSPSETFADPVNSLTGAYTASVSDLSLPGVGVAFDLTRSYTSGDTNQTRLGVGWTDSYSASLAVQPNGDVLAHGEEGQQVLYSRQQDGTFVGTPGALSTLTTISGGYKLVSHEQVNYSFDSTGKLQSVLDRNGQGVTLSYNGNGTLASVTDAAGRVASFSSNPDGTLAGVSLPDGRSVSYAYSGGRLTSSTDPRGKTTSYSYEASGKLATEVDPNGHTVVTNVYGADGRVSQQTDATGSSTSFYWDATTQTATATDARGNAWKDVYANNVLIKRIDALGNVTQLGHDTALDTTSVAAPSGATTTMTYDARGNLLQATAPASLGSVRKTTVYDAKNNVTSVTDGRGKVTTYGYDGSGNNTTVIQDGTTIATYTYDASGQVTSLKDGRNNTTTYSYDTAGNRTAVTDALGNKTTYTYDAAGRMTSKVEPRGNVQGANPNDYKTTYTYDADGSLLTETDPLGNVATTNTYDDAGNLLTVTDARGKTTTHAYDAVDRITSTTAPDGGVTTYTYDSVGNKLTERDPRNNVTTYTYDADNRVASVNTPLGNKTTYAYDANGNVTKQVEPRGNVTGANPDDYATLYTYDAAGRTLTQTDPLGKTTTYAYDAVGNRTSLTDANNHTTSYGYDGKNRLTSVTAAGGAVTTYTYDAAGNLLTRTDPNTHVTSYAYDAVNRLTSKARPLNRQWTYAYDAAGNRTQMVDANGNSTQTLGDGTTAWAYDRAGRLTGIDHSDSTPDVSFSYDSAGNRIQMIDGAGTQTYAYDNLDRLTQVTRGTDTFSYTYDLAGNITRLTYPGSTIDYTYDNDSRMATVASDGQTTNYVYDPSGNLLSTTLPIGNGYVEERTYDRADRVARVKSAKGANTLVDFTYARDGIGNPTQVVRVGSATGTTTYAYDARDRLTEVCFQASCPGGSDPFVRWTYDGVGNRLTEARPGSTATYTYNAADELTQVGSTSYSYDANGNETGSGSRTFGYDLANRLESSTGGGTTTTYTYDGEGNRLSASTGTQPSQTTNYLWDTNSSLPQLATERDGNGFLRSYVNGVRRIDMSSGSTHHFYAYDGLGSVANVTGPTGATEWTYSFEPFGVSRTETQDDPSAPANPMKFAGELSDPIGLYHLRARQYDPSVGRFLQGDPADPDPGLLSEGTYVYSSDRPTVLVDPSGMTGVPSNAARFAALDASSPESARGPCRIYAGDPHSTQQGTIWGTGWQRCRIAARFETRVCAEYKKSRFFGLIESWVKIDCNSGQGQTPETTTLPVLVDCKKGRHTYRIATYGDYNLLVPPPPGWSPRGTGSVESLNYLKETC